MISQGAQTNGLPVDPVLISPSPRLTKMVDLPEQTEEEFHENFLSLLTSPESRTDSLPTVISQISKHTSTTSPTDSTSSSGSYSLTQFKVSQLELPDENETFIIEQEIIKPPEGFADKKKKKIRAKSEEREFKIDAATQSSISLHASLHDLNYIEEDDAGYHDY